MRSVSMALVVAIFFVLTIEDTFAQKRLGTPGELDVLGENSKVLFGAQVYSKAEDRQSTGYVTSLRAGKLMKNLTIVGDNGKMNEGRQGEYPIWKCQGDCDNDDECRGGLLCFQRENDEPVPGCQGTGIAKKDYCYDPQTVVPSSTPSASPTLLVPTASPEPSFSPTETMGPTESPTSAPTRTELIVLNDDSQKPFGKCEGECTKQADCKAGLSCQKRGAYEFVPGCIGAGTAGVNFCYDPEDGPPPPTMPGGQYRFRLYWEKGYYWQETYKETFWCLEVTNPPMVKECKSSSAKFEFVFLRGEGDLIKVAGKDLCLDKTGNTKLTWEPCDKSKRTQRFKGDWTARRFDIRSIINHGCASQHHHPKSGEPVFLNSCERAHLTDTGYWSLY